jgi:hypothetical protein
VNPKVAELGANGTGWKFEGNQKSTSGTGKESTKKAILREQLVQAAGFG